MKKIGTFLAGVAMFSFLLIPEALSQQQGTKFEKNQEVTQSPTGQTPEISQSPTEYTAEKVKETASMTNQGKLLYANDLIGMSVVNPKGENIGEIEELVINPQEGRIKEVVASFGGFLGIGSKSVAIPWDELKLSPDSQNILLAMGKEELEQAPPWEKPREEPQQPVPEAPVGTEGAISPSPPRTQ